MPIQSQDLSWVETTLNSMTVEEKVGQLFVADLVAVYSHHDSPNYRYAIKMLHRYHVGGFVLAGGTVTDIALMTNALQRESKIPLLINADLESGLAFLHPWRYLRGRGPELPRYVAGGGTVFTSLMAFGATGNPQYAYELGRVTARESRAIGIHWTNTPVADVNNNPHNPIINTRSFGEEPLQVAKFVEAYVRGLQANGMMATLKHFPGHGDTEEDTHIKLPVLPFDENRLNAVELIPFKAGIAAGAKVVMTSHLALPKIDPSKRPATLSYPIITGLLREKLGFQGIVVTDGMTMQGITNHYDADEAAVLALAAGVDMILVPADFEKAYQGVLAAVKSGRLSEKRLEESVRRILVAKSWLGLDQSRFVDIENVSREVGAPESEALSEQIANASVTLLRNHNNLIPLSKTARVHIVTITEAPNLEVGRELEQALQPHVAAVAVTRLSNESSQESIQQVVVNFKEFDAVLMGVYFSIGAWKGAHRFAPAIEEFLAQIGRLPKPIITVAFGDPYVLAKLPTTEVVMTPYTGAPIGERAIGKAIIGKIAVTGKLPVTIPGKYKLGEGMQLFLKRAIE
ncbi:MAG: glycoside hydrolase family 3 protein [candidate division KSB1 bacterium]|nr:glycoside hydrolase family 3 protein [candidate division KSB1 bacterium]MDZ7300933.1 glycoside hydrolase family 3 protein [candidate division KSB1 bacterium]MDZ7310388.1 glycoside hydrolase family 3 protein [candidate division KSB1 bacterium]